ncbi:hypothetical protein GBAR_LOCUS28989, partial [Geodia barretti]
MTLERPCTRWIVSNSICVLWLCSCLVPWASVHAAPDLKFVIQGDPQTDDGTEHNCTGQSIKIGCAYRGSVVPSDVSLTTGNPAQSLYLRPESSWTFQLFDGGLSYTVSASDASGTRTYTCSARSLTATFTIIFDDTSSHCSGTTTSPTTQPTSPSTEPSTGSTPATTGSRSPPTGGGTSQGSTSSGETSFKGLKPLVYTVASVILLGTLAIVAIITCWIRARRSFHSRIIRPNNTPQDYLDYISDNEFTPLTTSEFLASLQERPPTYNQSEEMTESVDPQGTGDTSGGGRDEASRTQSSRELQPPATTTTSSGGTNEGAGVAVVERRRTRGGSAERERRRRRRVVIVENVADVPDVTVTITQGEVITNEEEGGATSEPHPSSQSSATLTEGDKGSANEGPVAVQQLVPLELANPPDHTPSPSQQEVGVIEARVSMVEGLSPPP